MEPENNNDVFFYARKPRARPVAVKLIIKLIDDSILAYTNYIAKSNPVSGLN